MVRSLFCLAILVHVAGCGGSKEPAKAPAPEGEAAAPDAAPEEAAPEPEAKARAPELPTECASKGDVCTPPRDFVDRLCQDVYPTVALTLFRSGTPWTRGYMTRKTEAWNASGGASVAGWLEFDEEVLILKHRAVKQGGVQVSGAGGGYEALRLNGACVTLSGEEVTLRKPPKAKYPKLEWKWIEIDTREALKNHAAIAEAEQTRRKECKGATMGDVSDKCVKADQKLSDAVVAYVGDGGELPLPQKLP